MEDSDAGSETTIVPPDGLLFSVILPTVVFTRNYLPLSLTMRSPTVWICVPLFLSCMKILVGILSLIVFTIDTCDAQFRSNAIGVVYLTAESREKYDLTIVLPLAMISGQSSTSTGQDLNETTLHYGGRITFFDEDGVIAIMEENMDFSVQMWCENDNGPQYRPILKTIIKKDKFKRALRSVGEIQNIACFVLLNKSNAKVPRPDFNVSTSIILNGDYDNDGGTDCFLWTYHDEAENCNGQPVNNLGVTLQVGEEQYRLRCCGQ